MIKKLILYAALESVFILVFNIVFFVLGGIKHPLSVWCPYLFIHFAYLCAMVTPFLIRKNTRKTVLGLSLYAVSGVYFFLEFVVGLVFIVIKMDSLKIPFVVQVILAGIYVVMLLVNMIANEHTGDSMAKREMEIAFIKTASSRVKGMMGKSEDKKINKSLEKLYDLLHSSPSHSAPEVKGYEEEAMKMLDVLEGSIATNNPDIICATASSIIAVVEKRNRELKSAK